MQPRAVPSTLTAKRSRSTRQGGIVREELSAADGFRSAQAVFGELRSKGETIGLSTVYRHLQALVDTGDADTLQNFDGESLYRLCGQTDGHHHHLVCRNCGRTIEIEGRNVERWAEQTAARHGFVDVDHRIELVGLCKECASQ
jgi:Fur family ferric uptake transcriptional regulator